MQTKTQGTSLKSKTNFKVQCSDLEGSIFDLGPRALGKFAMTMKYLEQYIGATYSNSFQPSTITDTPATFPKPYIPNIIPNMIGGRPKTDAHIT